jgi:hypothetical protein
MDEAMTKARLMDMLREAWAEWQTALELMGQERMGQKVQGDWSVRDYASQQAAAARRFVELSDAHFQDEALPMSGAAAGEGQERPLGEILQESDQAFLRLLEVVAAHDDPFLLQPQELPGLKEPAPGWMLLQQEVIDPTRKHTREVQAWIKRSQKGG